MRVPGWKTARLAGRWLRSRLVGGALILGYHRVAEAVDDPYDLCVAPRHFSEHLQVLRGVAHPISLRDLVQGLRANRLPRRAVAITFDDGYADLLYAAKSLLERYDVLASAFVVSGNLGRAFWWDQLAVSLQADATLPRQVSLTLNGQTYHWGLDAASAPEARATRTRVIQSVHRLLCALPPSARHQALRELESQAPTAAAHGHLPRALTPEEMARLTDGGLVEIGAHTVTHPALATLSTHDQQFEVQHSKAGLEELVGGPVRSFSYPHGSLTPSTMAAVREAGFELACASSTDLARPTADPLCLPRFWVRDVDGETFSRWLRTWLRP